MRPGYRASYFFLDPLEPERAPAPDHSVRLHVALELEVECATNVHVGSGVPQRVEIEGAETLLQGFASLPGPARPVPVVPDSSMKGAVRAIVEAITPSCERTGQGACRGTEELCPACVLFGAPGWRGLVSFSDLRPVGPKVLVRAQLIAQRYSHPNAPARGRRLYRRAPEQPQPREKEGLIVLAQGSRLSGEVRFAGADEPQVGLVCLALGLPPEGLPFLRLGGGKNRGLGVVTVALTAARIGQLGRGGTSFTVAPPDFVAGCEDAALRRWPVAKERLARIRREYQSP